MHHILKIDATPVEHGPFTGHAAKADDSQLKEHPVRFAEHLALGVSRLLSVLVPHQKGVIDPDNGPDHQDDGHKMPEGTNVEVDHGDANQRTGKPGNTPSPVKRGHDGALVNFLGCYTLGIDGDVAHVAEDAKQEECERQLPASLNQSDQTQHNGIGRKGKRQHLVTAKTGHQFAGEGHHQKLAHRQSKQDGSKHRIVQLERRFDVRNAARPGGEAEPHAEIDHGNCQSDASFVGDNFCRVDI